MRINKLGEIYLSKPNRKVEDQYDKRFQRVYEKKLTWVRKSGNKTIESLDQTDEVWIFGSGPSLRDFCLSDQEIPTGAICIGINDSWTFMQKHKREVDYIFQLHQRTFTQKPTATCIAPVSILRYFPRDTITFVQRRNNEPGKGDELGSGTIHYTLVACINLAYKMGAIKIVLVGCDANNPDDGRITYSHALSIKNRGKNPKLIGQRKYTLEQLDKLGLMYSFWPNLEATMEDLEGLGTEPNMVPIPSTMNLASSTMDPETSTMEQGPSNEVPEPRTIELTAKSGLDLDTEAEVMDPDPSSEDE